MNPDQQFKSTAMTSASILNGLYDHQHNMLKNGDGHKQSHRKSQYSNSTMGQNYQENEEGEAGRTSVVGQREINKNFTITMPPCPSSPSESAFSTPSSMNTPKNRGRHQPTEHVPSHIPHETDEFYSKNICIASTLVTTYLIEVTVQILLIVQCYRSLQLDLVTDTADGVKSSSSTSSVSWFLVISSVLSSFLVTLISIIWVFRGMDFSGRLCGRLLCYVMHSFLLGILWRYLKLAFAYDKADLEEFCRLKTIQTYMQSLPLVTIHVAWVLITHQQLPFMSSQHHVDSYHALSSWLVVVELLSAVISFIVLSSPTISSFTCNTNNLQGVATTRTSSSTSPGYNSNECGGNCSTFKVESCKSDNDPNRHFNDSGTASSVSNKRAAGDSNFKKEKSSCSSAVSSIRRLTTSAIKWMMSHYSQKCEPGRELLLVSRLISLGMLAYKMNYYWTGFIAILHFGVSFVWLGCWAVKSSWESNGNIKTASSSSSAPVATACQGANDANDSCCDTRSNDSSSNDSGLVVKSEVLMENGISVLVVPGDDGGDDVVGVDDNDDGEGHNNIDYSTIGCTRGAGRNKQEIKNKTRHAHVNSLNALSGGLSSCLSVVVHRRNNGINDKDMELSINNGKRCTQRGSTRKELLSVLPLTYVLFWDLCNSPAAFYLSTSRNMLSIWATALPVFLTAVENVCIIIYHHVSSDDGTTKGILTFVNATCLILGWSLIALYQFRWGRINQCQHQRQRMQNKENIQSKNDDDEYDDADSGYKGNSCIGGGNSTDTSVNSLHKKETGECLSLCCSSLSHPLNIKRKGHRDQQEKHNFCKDGPNDKISSVEDQQHDANIITTVKYNEYQEHQEIGKLMGVNHRHHRYIGRSKSNDDNNSGHQSSGDSKCNSTIKRKEETKSSTILPDLGLASKYTEVNIGEISNQPQSMMRYREDITMTKSCATASTAYTPVTNNNYTNIKEALTRRISNKSCTNTDGSIKKPRNQQLHQLNNNRQCQDRESVKGDDGEDEMEEGETKKAISSFKSSSSPCVQVPQHRRQQQHQPTTTNSNKCMPISIKSPISWLPETCCNDSSGSGGSSNSRNTNTLVMPEPTTNGSRLFYCPEKYIDLGNTSTTKNVEEAEESKRTCKKQQPKQQRQHNQTSQQSELEGNCDFSVVFFEGRAGGGTSRSYKQNQSRTPISSTALLQRTSRSANATPVASSKPFPLDTAATVQLQKHPYFQPSHNLHHHQYSSYNDHCEHDEVDPIEKATKDDDGGAAHRQIRSNQIMGKTYLSDGASLTSLDGLCEIRASTPVEIKKASRVIVNYPPPHHQVSDSKTVSRCLCKVERCPSPSETKHNRKQCGMSPLAFNGCVQYDHHPAGSGINSNNNNIYEKLIDDSYGILICEGENASGQNSVNKKNCNGSKSKSIESKNDPRHYHHQIIRLSEAAELRQRACGGGGGSQKLKILCAKCLENHDPLLTNCVDPLNRDDEDHHPTILDQYNNPTSINGLATMQNWQESHHLQHQSLPQLVSHSPYPYPPAAESDTTDYPSDTEFTTNNNPMEDDGQSLSTHFSSATYAWSYQNQPQHSNNPHNHRQNPQQQHAPKPTQLSQFIWAASSMIPTSSGAEGCENGAGSSQHCPKEFTGLEYVRTWLMASHPRTFAINNSNDNTNINSSTGGDCNNIRQHPLDHHYQQEQENGIKKNYKNSNGSLRRYATHHHHLQNRNDKGLTLLSSATTSKNNLIPFKNKSACDKTISKKKRYRQLEKRQRPVGRGASPPAKELCTSNNIGNVDVLNGIIATASTTVTATTSSVLASTTTTATTGDDNSNSSVVNTRFQPPPSRKQHPLLFYDMIPRQEQQKPLTATSHKKCRDQLDLFHKELETVV